MKTLLTILTVGSLAAHTTEDTSGLLRHVKFQSSNFENILTWDAGPASAPDTVYSVEYKKYGEKEWLAKAGCQRITQKFCNLTVETRNHTEFYYAKVTAVSSGGPPVTKMTDRFSSLQHTTIRPPDVTCIPKVRSIQMLVHPTLTPVLSEDGHQLTLEEIFHDLFYRLKLHVNHTYQMNLEGKQREYEFLGLTPDTEFLGSITILTPILSKESAPYTCRVKTLPECPACPELSAPTFHPGTRADPCLGPQWPQQSTSAHPVLPSGGVWAQGATWSWAAAAQPV